MIVSVNVQNTHATTHARSITKMPHGGMSSAVQMAAHLPVVPKAGPFVKWAGGKRKLLSAILAAAPVHFERYLEPFVGGGAVALALGASSMVLNDANAELINAYRAVRDDLAGLLALLDAHQRQHSEPYFYSVRAQKPDALTPIEQAARLIYLNKTCFNGLYRVNRRGDFNVPFGQYKNPIPYKMADLEAAAAVLQGAELYADDYRVFLKQHAHAGDFIYLDPPYVPVGKYADFKRYTKEQFYANDQQALADMFNDLVNLGAYPVLSNSYSDIALDLYAGHDIHVVYAARFINHEGEGRGPVREIIVRPRSE